MGHTLLLLEGMAAKQQQSHKSETMKGKRWKKKNKTNRNKSWLSVCVCALSVCVRACDAIDEQIFSTLVSDLRIAQQLSGNFAQFRPINLFASYKVYTALTRQTQMHATRSSRIVYGQDPSGLHACLVGLSLSLTHREPFPASIMLAVYVSLLTDV